MGKVDKYEAFQLVSIVSQFEDYLDLLVDKLAYLPDRGNNILPDVRLRQRRHAHDFVRCILG